MAAVVKHYEQLLLQNATRISSIESTLRSLTWFLPGRFQDAELASEALYSALNILGTYHDSVLIRSVATLPASLRPAPSSHLRYTKYFLTYSRGYKYLARLLQLITHLELLIEMGLRKRRGAEWAENSTVVIEAMKAVLRLAIFRITNGRSSVQPPVPEREVDPSVLDMHRPHVVGEPPNARISFEGVGESWKGSRTGIERPTLKSMREGAGEGGLNAWLKSRVLTLENAKRPRDLVEKTRGVGRIAELIWIIRPLIYVLAMKRYGRRHTLPYLLSLALEYFAYSLRVNSHRSQASGKGLGASQSDAEREETRKRARAFWWYLLRGPVWESWTRPQLLKISAKFEEKPLIGIVSTLIGDYVPLIDDYYFYTS